MHFVNFCLDKELCKYYSRLEFKRVKSLELYISCLSIIANNTGDHSLYLLLVAQRVFYVAHIRLE